MELIKFNNTKEKTEGEILWETAVRTKEIYSEALRLLTEEYPEKFGEIINFNPVVDEGRVILIGNFEIFETEAYKRVLEIEGEEKTYQIILKIKNG